MVLLLAFGACGPPPPPPDRLPNIFLIVLDTLRADRLGVYGNTRGLSPFIDELAARGTVFQNAYAPSSWTCPSVASLFSSRFASQHGVNSFDAVLAPEEVTLAERLRERGYVAAGFSANLRMLEQHGYAQGFDTWRAFINSGDGQLKPRGDLLRTHSLKWVERVLRSDPDKPKLLYLQYMEPHTPYDPPEPYRTQFIRGSDAVDEEKARTKLIEQRRLTPPEIERLESLYDGEVATVDNELRLLFGELGKAGLLENAIIVITADHGEEFGEHGSMLHGFTLFNGVMRIPLIIVAPGYPAGGVVDDNVSLVDVAPTLLELTGTTPSPSFEGRSLVPLLLPRYAPARLWAGLNGPDVIGEIEPFTGNIDLRRHSQAIVGGDQKLLVSPAGQMVMYNVAKDPYELEQLQPVDGLSQRLQAFRTDLKARARVDGGGKREMDDATREKLRALGYQP